MFEIYTKHYCPYCKSTKDLLDARWIEYKDTELVDREDLQKELTDLTWQSTVPYIFSWETKMENFIWGNSDLIEMEKNWKLDEFATKKWGEMDIEVKNQACPYIRK